MLFRSFPHNQSLRGALGKGYIRLHRYTYVERSRYVLVTSIETKV
jgi:hypothetical protein